MFFDAPYIEHPTPIGRLPARAAGRWNDEAPPECVTMVSHDDLTISQCTARSPASAPTHPNRSSAHGSDPTQLGQGAAGVELSAGSSQRIPEMPNVYGIRVRQMIANLLNHVLAGFEPNNL